MLNWVGRVVIFQHPRCCGPGSQVHQLENNPDEILNNIQNERRYALDSSEGRGPNLLVTALRYIPAIIAFIILEHTVLYIQLSKIVA